MKKGSFIAMRTLVLTLVMLCGFASALLAQTQPPTYAGQWGSTGSGPGQFNGPSQPAVDPNGNIWVADPGNQRVQKFSPTGTPLAQIGTTGTAGKGNYLFSDPEAVAIDLSGNIYVLDANNSRVVKYNPSGTYLLEWGSFGSGNGQFNQPWGIAVDQAGNVYVADTYNHRIQKFSSSGVYATQWGTNGTGDTQFKRPAAIAIDPSNSVFIVDLDNNRIVKYNSVGQFVTKWGSFGSDTGYFNMPQGVGTDASGHVYVGDLGNYRVQEFTNMGGYMSKWGTNGTGNGQFKWPAGVVVSPVNGQIYVADYGNNRIQRFTVAGSGGQTPPDSSAGVSPPEFVLEWGSHGSGAGQFDGPLYTTITPSGKLYVIEQNNARIQGFTDSGVLVDQHGSLGTGNLQFDHPGGMAVAPNGDLYIIDTGNVRVLHLRSDWTYVGKWGSSGSGPGQFINPNRIAVDKVGNVYVTDAGNYRVQKFTATGGYLTQWGTSGTANNQFSSLQGIVTDDSLHVFVIDANRVERFSSTGAYELQWGSYGSDSVHFNAPTAIAMRKGHVVVADRGNNAIKEFTTTGAFVTQWGIYGSGPGQFNSPTGVGSDQVGNVFVADYGNNRVQKFGQRDSSAHIKSIKDVPGDQGGLARIIWLPSLLDKAGSSIVITGYEIYRHIPGTSMQLVMNKSLPNSTQMANWDYVMTVPAHGDDEYSAVVQTLADSCWSGMNMTVFSIRAVTSNPTWTKWSYPDSGFSKDNLAPNDPPDFTAGGNGGAVTLHWSPSNSPDVMVYEVHRGTTPNFVPDASNLLIQQAETDYVDHDPIGGYYKVAAVDSGTNVSAFRLATSGVLAVSPTGQALSFALLPVKPNPTRGAVNVQFTLPVNARATLELIDVAGRIATQHDVTALGAGHHTLNLAEGWRPSPGLYFVRLTQAGRTLTSRIAVVQ